MGERSSIDVGRKGKPGGMAAYCRPSGADCCLVLRYSRVAQLLYDPLHLAVEPYIFERQMEYLAQHFNVIPLGQLAECLDHKRRVEPSTVAVTFDGGYADLLYTAKDVLQAYEIPATVFVEASRLLSGADYWFDELEDYLLRATIPYRLDIEVRGRPFCQPLQNSYERFRAYEQLYSVMERSSQAQRQQILAQLRSCLSVVDGEFDDHRTLDVQELEELAQSNLITIGSLWDNFGTTHRVQVRQLAEEIAQSKMALEQACGRDVQYFARWPETDLGLRGGTERVLKDLGFVLGFSDCYGMVNVHSERDRYELPRVKVGNWKAFGFHQFLKGFFE